MITRRLRDKLGRGQPITIENFFVDTVDSNIELLFQCRVGNLLAVQVGARTQNCHTLLLLH